MRAAEQTDNNMANKLLRFFLGIVLMLAVLALILFNSLLVWVATGPRSLSGVTPYVETALSDTHGNYRVKIGDTKLIWDGWKHPIDIRLKELSVLGRTGETITNFPEISLGISLLYLSVGRIVPTSLVINNPIINLVRNDDKTLSLGFKQSPEQTATQEELANLPLPALLAPFIVKDDENNFGHIKRVSIRKAIINVASRKHGSLFDASDVNILITRDRQGVIKITTGSILAYKQQTSNANGEFLLNPDLNRLTGDLKFSTILPSELADIFSGNLEIKGLAVPVSGKIGIEMDLSGEIKKLDFMISGGKGIISSQYLPKPLPVDSALLQGRFLGNFNDLDVSAFNLVSEGTDVVASASITSLTQSPAIEADIAIKNINAENLGNIWPHQLAPITRAWVTDNITSGKATEGHILLDIKSEYLNQPTMPKDAVDANIKVENLKIRYLPEHPQLEAVNGNIHIDGVGMIASVDTASYLKNTKLSNGHVIIDDLAADNPYIKIDLHADAPANDIVHFLSLPRLEHASHLGLKEEEITGRINGYATVGFYFFAPQGKSVEDVISYDIKSEVRGLTQTGFMKKFDGKNINGEIAINNNSINFLGNGEVNGANVPSLKVKYLFFPEKGFDTFIDTKATADIAAIRRFGYPDLPFVKGIIGVNAKVESGDSLEQIFANLDLTEAAIDLPQVGWKKPVNEQSTLSINSEKKNGKTSISSFNINSKELTAKGAASIADDFSGIESLVINKAVLGSSDISSLRYTKNGNSGTIIDITARSLDLSSYMEQSEASGEGVSFQNFPKIQLKADIGSLTLGKGREIAAFKGNLNCAEICQSANLSGSTGGKPFTIAIAEGTAGTSSTRTLAIKSEDAGSFLHAIGVIDGMNGGTLHLSGSYAEGQKPEGSTLTAKLSISEHTIKDAPLLGKILSLASFTGFIDMLQGNGIRFSELSIPFTLHNDVATIKNGKTHGEAIGITVDGTITFPQKKLDLQGTIVPSYALNSAVSNVPLIGEKITGGEGQGIFAANYTIKGTEKNEEVRVNPLSILTPGFLRGLFDIFDER